MENILEFVIFEYVLSHYFKAVIVHLKVPNLWPFQVSLCLLSEIVIMYLLTLLFFAKHSGPWHYVFVILFLLF